MLLLVVVSDEGCGSGVECWVLLMGRGEGGGGGVKCWW